MQLVVKKDSQVVNCFSFSKGPVYIGRHMHNQVFLADKLVSRQHAVIYTDPSGKWLIEDMASANKTFVNDSAVHKQLLNDKDIITIAGFELDFFLQEPPQKQTSPTHDDSLSMEDTIIQPSPEIEVTIRRFDKKDAPPINLPFKRIRNFQQAATDILKCTTIKDMHKQIEDILHGQFTAMDVWISLSAEPNATPEIEGGRKPNRETIKKSDILFPSYIEKAMKKHQYILIPKVPRDMSANNKIRSVMIAPVTGTKGCFGFIYTANSTMHEHFNLTDLDYLILLSINVAAALEDRII